MLKLKISQALPNLLQIHLECEAGQLHALVGPSGSGKTSTLRTIAGLSQAKTGRIQCDDEIWFEADDVSGIHINLPPASRSCGFLFQQYALFPHLTALENVCIPLYNSMNDLAQRKALAGEWLERMGIGELAKRLPNQLSGGQQQRLCIARALATDPEIMLFDEPTSALDPIATANIEELMSELKDKLTILVVTHNMQQAARVSDYTAYMYLGELMEFGDTDTIFTKPTRTETEDYITGKFG